MTRRASTGLLLALVTAPGCYQSHALELRELDAGAALDAELGPPRLIRVSPGPAAGELELCGGEELFQVDDRAGGIATDGTPAIRFGQRVTSCFALDFDRPASAVSFRVRSTRTSCGARCDNDCDTLSMLYVFAGESFEGALTLHPGPAWSTYELEATTTAITWYACRPDVEGGPVPELDAVVGVR
jgi:hypothetical protein